MLYFASVLIQTGKSSSPFKLNINGVYTRLIGPGDSYMLDSYPTLRSVITASLSYSLADKFEAFIFGSTAAGILTPPDQYPIKIFKPNGRALVKIFSVYGSAQCAHLSDNLRLFIGRASFPTLDRIVHTMQGYSPQDQMVVSSTQVITPPNTSVLGVTCLLHVPFTTRLITATNENGMFTTFDYSGDVVSGLLIDTSLKTMNLYHYKQWVLAIHETTVISYLDQSTLALNAFQPGPSAALSTKMGLLDNINEQSNIYTMRTTPANIFIFNVPFSTRVSPFTTTETLNAVAIIPFAPYGTPNNLMNFGPYQYLLTIPSLTTHNDMTIFLINKLAPHEIEYIPFTTPIPMATESLAGLIQKEKEFYFAYISQSNIFAVSKNFQSYSLSITQSCTRYSTVTLRCIACPPQHYLLNSTACAPLSMAPEGWGMSALNSQILPCAQPGCLVCRENYLQCARCNLSTGYTRVGDDCLWTGNVVTLQAVGQPLFTESEVRMSFLVTVDKPITGNPADIVRARPPSLFSNGASLHVHSLSSNILLVDLPLNVSNDWTIGYQNTISWREFDTFWRIKPFNCTINRPLTWQYPLEPYSSSLVRHLITFASDKSWWAASISLIALMLDPTGFYFRFTKPLQIASKLYLFNINYGQDLEPFLWYVSGLPTNTDPPELTTYAKSRGKLSRLNKVPLDFSSALPFCTSIYLISWLLLATRYLYTYLTLPDSTELSVLSIFTKIHLVVFNYTFPQVILLAGRLCLHPTAMPTRVVWIGWAVSILIAVDMFTAIFKVCYSPQRVINLLCVQTTGHENETGDGYGSDEVGEELQIDYERTYALMDANSPLLKVIFWDAKYEQELPWICRLMSCIPYIRVSIYSLVIVSCQYIPIFGFVVLILLECALFLANIYAYLKYKYLKNIICLLMEVSQGLILFLFSINALLIGYLPLNISVKDFHQGAGKWLVILLAGVAYLGLIITAVRSVLFLKTLPLQKIVSTPLWPIIFPPLRVYHTYPLSSPEETEQSMEVISDSPQTALSSPAPVSGEIEGITSSSFHPIIIKATH